MRITIFRKLVEEDEIKQDIEMHFSTKISNVHKILSICLDIADFNNDVRII